MFAACCIGLYVVSYPTVTPPLNVPTPVAFKPLALIRSLSLPPVSAVIVSAAGNLIAVFVSPVCLI